MSSERVDAKSLQALFSCTIPDALVRKMSKVNGKRPTLSGSPLQFSAQRPVCSGSRSCARMRWQRGYRIPDGLCVRVVCVRCQCVWVWVWVWVGAGGCWWVWVWMWVCGSKPRAGRICGGDLYRSRVCTSRTSWRRTRFENCCYEEICHGRRRYGKH